MDYSDFTDTRLKNTIKQGEYFQEEKLESAFAEMKKRGLLTDFQIEKERKVIKQKKENLSAANAAESESIQKESKSKLTWKPRYYAYILILSILLTVIIYLKSGTIAWYVPLGGVGLSVGKSKLFKSRFDK